MKKALFLCGGDRRDVAGTLAQSLQRAGASQCTIADDHDRVNPAAFDAVVVDLGLATLSDMCENALCDWVAEGGALVAIHSAADSACSQHTRHMDMIGSAVVSHGAVTQFNINISDPHHEITRGMADFRIIDTFLILERRTECDLHWLLSGNWQGKVCPLAYVRDFGRGRVFCTALGHDERAIGNPAFQKLIQRAIAWTTRSIRSGPVRCGVVGYGGSFSMGKYHADIIRATPGLELSAICELDPRRLVTAGNEQPGVHTFANVGEMAASDRVDIAAVVTPHNTHAPIALELLKAGVGVICEKPFCITVDDATRMIEAARDRNLPLTVFHNRRWDADFLTIQHIIARGLLGDVFHIEAFHGEYKHPGYWWRSDKAISGGAVYDWGAHYIDWILNLMPRRIESVTGFFGKHHWYDVTNEDHCKVVIRFEGGRAAEIELSHLAAAGKPKWRILGTHGGLIGHWNQPLQVTSHVTGSSEKLEIPLMETRGGDTFYVELVDHLLADAAPPVTPESARRVIAVLEGAERSKQTGQAEPIPFEKV